MATKSEQRIWLSDRQWPQDYPPFPVAPGDLGVVPDAEIERRLAAWRKEVQTIRHAKYVEAVERVERRLLGEG